MPFTYGDWQWNCIRTCTTSLAFKSCGSGSRLNLGHNPLSAPAMKELTQSLLQHYPRALRELNLSGCHLTDPVAHPLITALQSCFALTTSPRAAHTWGRGSWEWRSTLRAAATAISSVWPSVQCTISRCAEPVFIPVGMMHFHRQLRWNAPR